MNDGPNVTCALCNETRSIHYEALIPMFRSRELVPDLLSFLSALDERLPVRLHCCFVVDGNEDGTAEALANALDHVALPSRVLVLSRNFGVGPALQAGLESTQSCSVFAFGADLQEPSDLFLQFFEALQQGDVDIVLGQRTKRDDPWTTRLPSAIFWALNRLIISDEIPQGGYDVFAVSHKVAKDLSSLYEKNTNITSQLLWLGYRRRVLPFHRLARRQGKSTWSVGKKIRLFFDSFYGFTDLPIRLLQIVGVFGIAGSITWGIFALVFGVNDGSPETHLALVIALATSLNLFALGVVGGYVARSYDNTKLRPTYIVQDRWDNS